MFINTQVLAEGWASPLKGFMLEDEYLQTLHFNCMQDTDNINQSVPIVLPVTDEQKEKLSDAGKAQLAIIEIAVCILLKAMYLYIVAAFIL